MADEIERLKNQNNALQEHNRRLVKELQKIVRCKDCIYREKENGLYWCRHEEGLVGDATDNDYCSHGERKGGVE